jgi:hypothetical protein
LAAALVRLTLSWTPSFAVLCSAATVALTAAGRGRNRLPLSSDPDILHEHAQAPCLHTDSVKNGEKIPKVISGRYLPEINQCKSSRSMHTIDASIAGNERKILVQYIESAITMLRLQNWNSNSSSVSFERLQCFINRRRSSKCLSHTWNTKKRSFLHQLRCKVRGSPLELKLDQTTFPLKEPRIVDVTINAEEYYFPQTLSAECLNLCIKGITLTKEFSSASKPTNSPTHTNTSLSKPRKRRRRKPEPWK